MTPDDGNYMVAAYIVAALVYSIYTITLFVRGRKALRKGLNNKGLRAEIHSGDPVDAPGYAT